MKSWLTVCRSLDPEDPPYRLLREICTKGDHIPQGNMELQGSALFGMLVTSAGV